VNFDIDREVGARVATVSEHCVDVNTDQKLNGNIHTNQNVVTSRLDVRDVDSDCAEGDVEA
jgi:hypothetical protein